MPRRWQSSFNWTHMPFEKKIYFPIKRYIVSNAKNIYKYRHLYYYWSWRKQFRSPFSLVLVLLEFVGLGIVTKHQSKGQSKSLRKHSSPKFQYQTLWTDVWYLAAFLHITTAARRLTWDKAFYLRWRPSSILPIKDFLSTPGFCLLPLKEITTQTIYVLWLFVEIICGPLDAAGGGKFGTKFLFHRWQLCFSTIGGVFHRDHS